MDEELKKAAAVFRYGVIADFVNGILLPRGERRRKLEEKSAQKWVIPGSIRSSISVSTIKEWIRRYKASGNKLESLYPVMQDQDVRVEDMMKTNALLGIRERFMYAVSLSSIAVITGDVGSGKSSALRFAQAELHQGK